MKIITKINTFLRKKLGIGFMRDYPFRTSTEFIKKYFGNREIVCVEIGTFDGSNALHLLEKVSNIKKIYLIDPWINYEYYCEKINNKKTLSSAHNKAKKRLKKYGEKVVFIRKFSDDALKDIPEKVDFIYIDGNHDYEFVKNDMENYWNKIKEGGVMAGHDIDHVGVSKAFCEFVVKNKIKNPRISIMDWILIKE